MLKSFKRLLTAYAENDLLRERISFLESDRARLLSEVEFLLGQRPETAAAPEPVNPVLTFENKLRKELGQVLSGTSTRWPGWESKRPPRTLVEADPEIS